MPLLGQYPPRGDLGRPGCNMPKRPLILSLPNSTVCDGEHFLAGIEREKPVADSEASPFTRRILDAAEAGCW